MKKIIVLLAVSSLVLSLGSCKPKQSAYRQVYEQARQREVAQQQSTPPQQSSSVVVSRPVQSDVQVRRERLEALQGEDATRLKSYSVVVGAFRNHTNAYSLKERLERKGYHPVLGRNEDGMLRVIITSFSTREEAARSRDEVRERFAPEFADAWILQNVR